jgi:hypothetical protein
MYFPSPLERGNGCVKMPDKNLKDRRIKDQKIENQKIIRNQKTKDQRIENIPTTQTLNIEH